MIRYFCYLSICFLSLFANLNAKGLNVAVQADSAIVMNAETGAILFKKNDEKAQFPASLTKIGTAIYTLNVRGNKLDKMLEAEHDSVASISEEEKRRSNYTIPSHWLEPGTSHIGIKRGEILSLKDLLYGLMLASAGDAANVIANYIGGSVPTFMDLLNEYFKEIGCHNTTFKNPHGLHHPDHKTNARDMAILTRESLKNQTFREIVKTVRYPRPQTNKQKPTTLIQTNRLLRRGKFFYPKAIGVKTGYTSIARHNLVAAAYNGDRTLIVVLMKCEGRERMFLEAAKLFEAAFNEKKVRRKLMAAGPQKFVLSKEGASKKIKTCLKNNLTIDYFPTEAPKVKCLLQWDDVDLPVEKGQVVGTLTLKDGRGEVLLEQPLLALDRVDYSWFYRIQRFFSGKMLLKVFGSFLAVLLIAGFVFELRRS